MDRGWNDNDHEEEPTAASQTHHDSTPYCCHKHLLVGWAGVLCEDGQARGNGNGRARHGTGTTTMTAETGRRQGSGGRGSNDRGTTKDEGDNGERRAMPSEGRDEEPPLPIPRAMAHRVGWGMLTNTAVFLIYILPPTPSTIGVAFYFHCNVSSMSDFYYCRNTYKMIINSNNNNNLQCHFNG
jgi:hypothetical protein